MHQKIKFDNLFQILHYLIGEKNVGALFHWVFFFVWGKFHHLEAFSSLFPNQNFTFVTFPQPNVLNVPEKYSGFKKELSRFLVIEFSLSSLLASSVFSQATVREKFDSSSLSAFSSPSPFFSESPLLSRQFTTFTMENYDRNPFSVEIIKPGKSFGRGKKLGKSFGRGLKNRVKVLVKW